MGHLQNLVESTNNEINAIQASIERKHAIFQEESVFVVSGLVLSESVTGDISELRYLDKQLDAALLEMKIRDINIMLEDEDGVKAQYDKEMETMDLINQRKRSGVGAIRAKEMWTKINDRISELTARLEKLTTRKSELQSQIQKGNSAKGGASTKLKGKGFSDTAVPDGQGDFLTKISPETLDQHWNPQPTPKKGFMDRFKGMFK
jgi:hypothetical protein